MGRLVIGIKLTQPLITSHFYLSELSANRNFHPLDGAHHQEAQLSVEGETGPNDIQCCSGAISVIRLVEGVKIAAKAVVVDRL